MRQEPVLSWWKKRWEIFHQIWWKFLWITKFGEKLSERMFTKFGETKCCETFFTKFSENFNPLFGEPFLATNFSPNLVKEMSPKRPCSGGFSKSGKNFHQIWWKFMGNTEFGEKSSRTDGQTDGRMDRQTWRWKYYFDLCFCVLNVTILSY